MASAPRSSKSNCAADHTDISEMVNDAEDKLFHKILDDATIILFGRYHNESLDSLTIILLYGSFLKMVISIYSLIIVFMRLVMFIKRICYVM